MTDFDIAILGSGFGGSLLAMVARRLGYRVILIEKGSHPRFAIGESTSPLMNLLIEELATRYDLPRLLPLTTWGAWQRTYPEVIGGMKRGFTYFHHEAGKPYRPADDRSNQLLVAASPSDEVSDSHWLRSSVDHFLLNESLALGVAYSDRTQVDAIERTADAWRIVIQRASGARDVSSPFRGQGGAVTARLLIDATGPRGALSRLLELSEAAFDRYPATHTLYTHFTGVARCDEIGFMPPGDPPYRADDAALHHCFDGGWMWVLRFNSGVTSAGFACEPWLAEELRLSEGAAAWPRFLARFPSIAEQFARAEPILPFIYSPRLPYRCSAAAGDGWAMLPSAAAFVDPLFSTGMPLTLLGIERLANVLERGIPDSSALAEYGRLTLEDADWTARYIAACYTSFDRFPDFTDISMFYFAAASFNEVARRLDQRDLTTRFLASDHPSIRPAMLSISNDCIAGRCDGGNLHARIRGAIAPINIAGLDDSTKRNWYPVDLDDLVRSAAKLGYTPDAMREIVATAPWAQS